MGVRKWLSDHTIVPLMRMATEYVAPAIKRVTGYKSVAEKQAEATAKAEAGIQAGKDIAAAEAAKNVPLATAIQNQHIAASVADVTSGTSFAGTILKGTGYTAGALVLTGAFSGAVGTVTDGAGWTGQPGVMSWGAQIGDFMTGLNGEEGTSFTSNYIDRNRRRDYAGGPEAYDDAIVKMGNRAQTEFQIPVQKRSKAAIESVDQAEAQKVRPKLARAAAAASEAAATAGQEEKAREELAQRAITKGVKSTLDMY